MTIDFKNNKWIQLILISSVTGFIFFLIFQKIDMHEVISIINNANKIFILLSIIPLGISLFFNASRWQIVLHAMGYEIPLKECFIIFMAAIPFSSITPAKSGDIVRAYYLKKEIPVVQTVGSVITERTFDLALLIFLSSIGIFLNGIKEFLQILILLMALLGVFLLFSYYISKIPFPDTWHQKIQTLFISMKDLVKNRKALLSVIFFSSIIWILAILQTILLFSALSITVPVSYLVGTLPIAILIGMIPVTLGGMGTRDAAIIILFSAYATSGELLTVALLYSLFRYWLLAIAGLPFIRIATKGL